jgi:glycosyltransferase involved in cell wall biosynthesis
MPTVSFIIPAYNEERLLPRTLAAIKDTVRAIGEPAEIIVVDDASTDRTAAVAQEQGARVIPVHCRQIAATRNAGGRAAQSEMFIFVDADTLVTEAAVRAAIAAMRAGAAGGGCAVRFDGHVPLLGHIILAVLIPLYRAAGLAAGCFIFCTRDAFHAVGGFDETLFCAEEVVMSRALRRQGRFVLLREFVITSARKIRSYSAREILGVFLHLALSGRKGMGTRDKLDIWYGERRADPESDK